MQWLQKSKIIVIKSQDKLEDKTILLSLFHP